MKKKASKPNPGLEAFQAGYEIVRGNPVLKEILSHANLRFDDSYPMAKEDWARVHGCTETAGLRPTAIGERCRRSGPM